MTRVRANFARCYIHYREPLKGSSQVVRICVGKIACFLPAEGKQNSTSSPDFTQPGNGLLEIACIQFSNLKSILYRHLLTAVTRRFELHRQIWRIFQSTVLARCIICKANPSRPVNLQGSAYRLSRGVVNFVAAVAYHFCLALPAPFAQPGDLLIAEPCTFFIAIHCQALSDRNFARRAPKKFACCHKEPRTYDVHRRYIYGHCYPLVHIFSAEITPPP